MRRFASKNGYLLALTLSCASVGLGLASRGFARDRALQPEPGVARPTVATPHAEVVAATGLLIPTHSAPGTPSALATLAVAPASPTVDPAARAARDIARRVRGFHSFRDEIPLATWRSVSTSTWRVRSQARCLAAADKLRLPARPLERALLTPVPTPIVLDGPVAGVSYRPVQSDREIELSCELATRLPALSALLKAHGVRVAHVNSSYRDQPRVSFHTFGLALDISSFETAEGPLVVASDFELSPDVATCDAKPATERGRAILALACALANSGLFSSVLTPNYNAGHRDHFHLDIRPNDSRLFLR
ncbi:MAG: hypothetical protein RLZZ450_1316 [Pseudomonadota bacterium]